MSPALLRHTHIADSHTELAGKLRGALHRLALAVHKIDGQEILGLEIRVLVGDEIVDFLLVPVLEHVAHHFAGLQVSRIAFGIKERRRAVAVKELVHTGIRLPEIHDAEVLLGKARRLVGIIV